ncbi:MAG: hypothetical protein OXR66_07050 [Candidatus Woesearchaeota archaeon]|nr:hypothetical protein [Candidatus Woesearchaeota archaeon]
MLETPIFTEEIPAKGAVNGHVRFTMHSETISDVALVGTLANVTSSLLFEKLQAQGTNIIFRLGDAPRIDILARREDDGLELQWAPQQIEAGKLSDIQKQIKDKILVMDSVEEPEPEEVQEEEQIDGPPADIVEEDDEEQEFWSKHLTRIP